MRVVIFVAVLAAHIMLLWLFPSLRRLVVPPVADEVAVTPIFLPPLSEPVIELPLTPEKPWLWQAPLPYHSTPANPDQVVSSESPLRSDSRAEQERSRAPQQPALQEAERLAQEPRHAVAPHETPTPPATPAPAATPESDSKLSSLLGPPSPTPDWRVQAELTAQTTALQIVEAEDAAARRAAALTARFKPLPGPRVRGPEFGWDYAHTHRVTHAEGGGLLIALNDRCAIFIFLLPMIGCSIGHQPPANGDLFKFMHKPVKFGDWDWRLDDP
jgi:hypothetical protein